MTARAARQHAVSAQVTPIEDGFLVPPGHPGAGEVTPSRFVMLPVPGVEHSPQYFRYSAALQGDPRAFEFFVLIATPGGDPSAAPGALPHLERAFPSATVALLLDARTGWARASASALEDAGRKDLAAGCVAAVLAGASWDESDPILVALDEENFAVSLVHESERWHAVIRAQTAPP
ncbi:MULTISPECIES: hypothetical protein [Sorangium]|uniref:Uncharacterized protein n=1 Tax=Sorangium cellulosum (strain So ce56) TaxID=448385 RepID=A9FY27_SORC5|nr:hypothetical protein [Sorangium cellulosum]CAN95575.1 hypothetical protein predicted by Glimmer/Critica [Sorangium cellulosum So ce56]